MRQLLECLRSTCVLCTIFVFAGSALFAEDIRLAWNPNRESGLAGYKLHIGTESGRYSPAIDVGAVSSYTVTALGRGMHYFALTAYDSKGRESGYSNEVFVAIDAPDGASAPAVRTTGNAATITWTTAQPSSVFVEYGAATDYGNATPWNSFPSTKHTVALTGLTPGTTYHFRIRSLDSQGNLIISSDWSFTTAATQDGPAALVLAYPRVIGRPDAGHYTGIALVNLDTTPALLAFKPLAASGTSNGAGNVANSPIRILNPGEQTAIVESEIFGGVSAGSVAPDWIEIRSSAPDVAGFFVVFDGDLASLSGANLSAYPLSSLVFPGVSPEAMIRVMLRNPGDTAAVIACDLVKTDGSIIGSVSRTIDAGSSLAATVMELFAGVAAPRDSYLRITSDQPLYGYEFLESNAQWISVLTRPPAGPGTKTLYAAQYVYGGPWTSEISVINADIIQDTLTLRWMADDGNQIGGTCTAALPGFGKVQLTNPSCFAVTPQQIQQGYVEIKAGQSGIMGSIVLRDLEGSRPATSLPLLSELRTSYIIPHVASDETYFTGIAILNPGDSYATVTTQVLDSSGGVVATLSEHLPSQNRKSRVLTEMFPGLIGRKLLSGYIRITSDQPLAVFALFGTNDLATLLALPAQPAP
jgi:hypothetical protein